MRRECRARGPRATRRELGAARAIPRACELARGAGDAPLCAARRLTYPPRVDRSTTKRRARAAGQRGTTGAIALLAGAFAATASCGISGGSPDAQLAPIEFAPVDPALDVLAQLEIDAIVEAAALAVDSPVLAIVVTDRLGNALRIWNRGSGGAPAPEYIHPNKIALALARSAALLSNSEAPFSSRGLQALSSFHFPLELDELDWVGDGEDDLPSDLAFVPDPNSMPLAQRTLGLPNSAPGLFWQLDASHRGAPIESGDTQPPTAYNPAGLLPVLANPDGGTPSPGLVALPGGLPLYKRTQGALAAPGSFDVERRLVGGLGIYVPDPADVTGRRPLPDVMEYACRAGLAAAAGPNGEDFAFAGIPPQGLVHVDGFLVPYALAVDPPPGVLPGSYAALDTVLAGGSGAGEPDSHAALAGTSDAYWLVPPRSSLSATAFAAAEVESVLEACKAAALATESGLRLPGGSPTRVVAAVVDLDGVVLGLLRMDDAALFGVEAATAKARAAAYYSNPLAQDSGDVPGPNPGLHPLRNVFASDPAALAILLDPAQGIAVSTRTLAFLSHPYFPPGVVTPTSPYAFPPPGTVGQIDPSDPAFEGGPLYVLALENRKPFRFAQLAFAPAINDNPTPPNDTQNGLVLAPGGFPLYRDGALIGALGVAGDAPAQDERAAYLGILQAQQSLGFTLMPPPEIRAEQFDYAGIALPYAKLPQNPDG